MIVRPVPVRRIVRSIAIIPTKMRRVLQSPYFWLPFLASLVIVGLFFGWELGLVNGLFPSLPRVPATNLDILFTIILGVLLSLTTGLTVWTTKRGSCPAGVKSATGIAGVLGAVTLFCPVCVVLPASLLGLGFVLTVLTPFLPLLRIIAIILLTVSIWMLRPRS